MPHAWNSTPTYINIKDEEVSLTWVSRHPLQTIKNIFDLPNLLFCQEEAPQARLGLDERPL